MYKRVGNNFNTLPAHPSPKWILDIFENDNSLLVKFPREILNQVECNSLMKLQKYIKNGQQLNEDNYKDVLSMLVKIEDAYVCKEIDEYLLRKQKVSEVPEIRNDSNNSNKNKFTKYKCVVPNLADVLNDVQEGDFLILIDRYSGLNTFNVENLGIYCRITKINDNEIEFKQCRNDKVIETSTQLYDIKFEKDRTNTRMELESLKSITPFMIKHLLFPKLEFDFFEKFQTAIFQRIFSPISFLQYLRFNWFSPNLCEEQKQAVVRIVDGTAYPAPYILYGPPGTGKTVTLVEAIAQIWKRKPNAHLLVSATSNSACDEIAYRLLKLNCIPDEQIFRYYSSAQIDKTSEVKELARISNLNMDGSENSIVNNRLKSSRIIICTLLMSGRLISNGLGPNFFDYIFIDEAGSATEPSAIIPLQKFASNKGSSVNVILAGDPKQLGPVIKCKRAENLGLGQSLLERLMNLEIYKSHWLTKKYNTSVLTHLVQNFRSNPYILHVSNTLFYDGKLLSCASSSKTNLAVGWIKLPNPSVPIIFHTIRGNTESDDSSYSKFNKQEINEVMNYINNILNNGINGKQIQPKDIGIVSPYKKQCELIRKKIWYYYRSNDIVVDTVEKFQGQERDIIIVSTVRSKTRSIGFLDNPKRLNVTLTRAKSLLIVIGNPDTLQCDKNWASFINFCKLHSACIGYIEEPEFVYQSNHQSDVPVSTVLSQYPKNWVLVITVILLIIVFKFPVLTFCVGIILAFIYFMKDKLYTVKPMY